MKIRSYGILPSLLGCMRRNSACHRHIGEVGAGVVRRLCRSAVYSRKRIGPNTYPCRTPHVMRLRVDMVVPHRTKCVQSLGTMISISRLFHRNRTVSSDAAATSHDRQCQTPPKDQVAQVLPDFQHRWPLKYQKVPSTSTVSIEWCARLYDAPTGEPKAARMTTNTSPTAW